ncbi:MAG: hypothetical protein VKN15_00855 [Cyanobacteriota bacterium]|nr:hypothetical protein [Cyanobacteriota bacterium]
MSRERDPFRIPRAGVEAAPLAGLASVDLRVPGSTAGSAFVAESTLGAVAVYALYQALLSALRAEAMVRRGELSRQQQAQLVFSTVWSSVQQGAAVGLVLGVLLLVFPWLSLPLTVLGAVGAGKASLDLFHAFWDGLTPSQQADLHEAAHRAGVNLGRLVRGSREALLGS